MGWEEEYGYAHHGKPILTKDMLDACNAMSKWIQTAREAQKKFGGSGYGDDWIPTEPDIIKSRLFWRIRSGVEPLAVPPPRCFSCPWYEVVEIDEPHDIWDVHGSVMTLADLLHREGNNKEFIVCGQCGYDVHEVIKDKEEYIVGYHSYRFRLWLDKERTKAGWEELQKQPNFNKETWHIHEYWLIQREPSLEIK